MDVEQEGRGYYGGYLLAKDALIDSNTQKEDGYSDTQVDFCGDTQVDFGGDTQADFEPPNFGEGAERKGESANEGGKIDFTGTRVAYMDQVEQFKVVMEAAMTTHEDEGPRE